MVSKGALRDFLDGIRALMTFFTVIPMGGSHSIQRAFDYAWLSPLIIPLITGLIPGLVGSWVWRITNNPLASSSIAYSLLLVLTGFNHIDGFADTVDALMIRGDVNERLRVLKDPHKGPVAIASTVLLIILSISFLTTRPSELWEILYVAEVTSKASCCTSALLGREPSYQGLGYALTRTLRRRYAYVLITDLASAIISYLILGPLGAISLVIVVALYLPVFNHLQNSFGGAVGDLYGFTLEVTRTAAIILQSLMQVLTL
ncbi:adenosylcobinamide-GDP ribazoletransferase [Vulcanisaeta thermophila]|uniref:adenosylcobinamide-GDP ribazoletransferase n=1 Tax=Vulcanisaeta thermophila TaxID=867917 RepID=UPI001EE28816|nr:adenosylcobinamide-GDP ribazoletransferase [Vulcanisaeta thermophila]